jgi:hypothetical protein
MAQLKQIKANKIKRFGAPQFDRAISGRLADYGGVRMGLGDLWTGVERMQTRSGR